MAITANQAQGLVLALFGASAGGHLTSLSSGATSVSGLAADLSTSAGLILGRDLSANATFRDFVLSTNLKLTGAALTAAQTWMDGEFTKGTARGDILAAAVTYLDGLTDTSSVFYAAATSYRATVTSAVTWSQGAGSTVLGVSALRAQQGNVDAVAGQSFTLTTSAAGDVFTGMSADDNISGTVAAAGSTYTTADTIVDSSTTDNDTLTLATTANLAGTGPISNIENIIINHTSFTSGAFTLDKASASKVTVNNKQAAGADGATVDGVASGSTVTAGTGMAGATDAFIVRGRDGATALTVDGGTSLQIKAGKAADTTAAAITLNITSSAASTTTTPVAISIEGSAATAKDVANITAKGTQIDLVPMATALAQTKLKP